MASFSPKQIMGVSRPKMLKWFGGTVHKNIRVGMQKRIKVAAMMLRDQVVRNISRPVTKLGGVRRTSKGKFAGARVDPASRSKPGEFPKADTTRLMKDIFWRMETTFFGGDSAIVGTTLDYGAALELSKRLDRSFLRRTHKEQLGTIRKILTSGPKLPGQR